MSSRGKAGEAEACVYCSTVRTLPTENNNQNNSGVLLRSSKVKQDRESESRRIKEENRKSPTSRILKRVVPEVRYANCNFRRGLGRHMDPSGGGVPATVIVDQCQAT